ncbi:glycoside hydrolase family 43 protein [Clostridium estertheticum]|uniref:glycoside hydrolase family 43 protein n=1 Tax=Clostridium estertheticum TaxID=238834 RepID=UPI001C7E1885|nr:glycoside hydrolase family 43 protein [Clostridium estertheticum]MBX4263180.1 glycoside hydrolase family 43 protein [Clostridium estertheticum]WLC89485.1 glycoside hydrolase family 43 protein [Clostridium estertheticum]
MKTFINPILPGFYPDPSICRVKEDYYLVTSSFAYYPGVPIFHSRDLVNWKQIGHVLDRPSQLQLDGLGQSRGIFAPTIRYNDGVFYMITTNMDGGGNFIVTATDPCGPWTNPYYLDAQGMDPSLLFDDDGKVYYTGTRPAEEGPKYDGNWEIWLQELDLQNMKLIGKPLGLWRGALRGAIWPEGPHLYKINGDYYLMISEGGTGPQHAVSVARSSTICGPYVGNPGNPILTHRHLGKKYPIVNVGHCDLVETQNGEWWAVALASRIYGGYYRNLGRETYLVPVIWEDGWPVMSAGTGKVELTYNVPNLPEGKVIVPSVCDDFDEDTLNLRWNFIRTPREEFFSLSERKGYLRLNLRPERITERVNPSFVGRRQQHIKFSASTLMEFTPLSENEVAGIVLLQSNDFNFSFIYTKNGDETVIRLIKCTDGDEKIIAEKAVRGTSLYLKVEADGQDYSFYYGESLEKCRVLIENVDGRILSTDVAGGFVGTEIGLYASSNGIKSDNKAYFDWFKYYGEDGFNND